jgi:hypothetical protein
VNNARVHTWQYYRQILWRHRWPHRGRVSISLPENAPFKNKTFRNLRMSGIKISIISTSVNCPS